MDANHDPIAKREIKFDDSTIFIKTQNKLSPMLKIIIPFHYKF